MENEESSKINYEDENVENEIKNMIKGGKGSSYNFLVNASNQANLVNTYNLSPLQLNSIFVLISPYYIENFNIEDLNINVKINEEGIVWLNDKEFKTLEIEKGVKVFGIVKQE
ncbi:hypothetical protein [Abyssisolibacter fermentans]|uniref:hypothetical protein n=1 Tax=Abyssisolibacter fermentans TaxID=1766203 RepID=UPI001FA6A9D8|nr:hypothetical protein [Abyssisolibacter fermentans]